MSHQSERNWAAIFGIIAILLLVMAAVSYIWFPFLMWGEQRDAGQEVVESQMSAEEAIQTYREFRTLYAEIEAQRAQVENSYEAEEEFHETYGDDPSEWSRSAEVRHGRLHDRITGNQNHLENLVADYNSMASDATQSVFQCQLPYQVDERFAITGPPGSGDAEQPQDTTKDGEPIEGTIPPAEECDGLPSQAEA